MPARILPFPTHDWRQLLQRIVSAEPRRRRADQVTLAERVESERLMNQTLASLREESQPDR